jgi:hypothetical protein
MQAQTSVLAAKFAALFEADGLQNLCEHYTFPLPVQAGHQMIVCQTQADLARIFSAYLDGVQERGLIRPSVKIAAVELQRGGRFRIWTDWCFTRAADQMPVHDRTIYFCRDVSGRVQIEMIACTTALPAGSTHPIPALKTA